MTNRYITTAILIVLALLVVCCCGTLVYADGQEDSINVDTMAFSYTSEYVTAQSPRIGQECDKIIKRLEQRYGKPKVWHQFPVIFTSAPGGNIAGYTSYITPVVSRVVVYQTFEQAVGGTLDHELTHAFFFYYLNSNFDLFLNEGLAQNSEYKRRATLRQTVYMRYCNGDFWTLDRLYNRNQYDDALRIYHEGFSVVDFLIARGGSKWFAAFMDDLTHKSRDIDDCLRRYYGYESLKEFEKVWIKFIEDGQNVKSVQSIH